MLCSFNGSKEAQGDEGSDNKGSSTKMKVDDGSRHVVGFKWEDEYAWLIPHRSKTGEVVGIYCKLCRRHKYK